MEALSSFMSKLSSYNILTNLVPGAILCVLLRFICGYQLLATDMVILDVFIIYFVGMVNNRFSSLIVEPFLKWVGFIKFADYKRYVDAEKKDEKISMLNAENNMYRSFIAVILLTILALVYKHFEVVVAWIKSYEIWVLLFLLLALFACSYRKQTSYIRKRVDKIVPPIKEGE